MTLYFFLLLGGALLFLIAVFATVTVVLNRIEDWRAERAERIHQALQRAQDENERVIKARRRELTIVAGTGARHVQ